MICARKYAVGLLPNGNKLGHIISTVGFESHTQHGAEGNYPKFAQYSVAKQARIDFW